MSDIAGDRLDRIVSAVPTAPMPTSYHFQIVQQEGEEIRIIMSFASPAGVHRSWWDQQGLTRFANDAFEVVKESRVQGSKLIVANQLPKKDLGAEAAQKVAQDLLRGHIDRGGLKK